MWDSAENGGVSWLARAAAKRPDTLNAPIAARAAAPPGVAPVDQNTRPRDPRTAAGASARYTQWLRPYGRPQGARVSSRVVRQAVCIGPRETWCSFWRPQGQCRRAPAV